MRIATTRYIHLTTDHLPIGLSQEKALAPPTGFARVFGGALLDAEAGEYEAAAAPIAAIPFSPS